MSERLVECSTCGVLSPEAQARDIPTHAPEQDSYVDGYYCEAHAAAALERARAHIASLDLEDDERDDMMPLMMLVALLRARGQLAETLPPGAAPGEGMERIRQETLALLARLGAGERLAIVEPTALCSACYRPFLASQVRVIPCYNDSAEDYVTSFRCGECWRSSLGETRARLEAGTDRDITQLCEFFARHAIFVHEHRRGDPPEVVRPLVSMILDRIADGDMKLAIGETVPLADVLERDRHEPPSVPQDRSSATRPPAPPPAPAAPPPSPSLWTRISRAFGRKRD